MARDGGQILASQMGAMQKGLAAQAAHDPQQWWGLAHGQLGNTFTSDSFTLTTNNTNAPAVSYTANTLR